MTEEVFTEPDDTTDGWVDVRMSDPERGEWDIDAVVVGGRMEYVDLRIRPALLASFVGCLLDDVGDERAAEILAEVTDRRDLAPGDLPRDEQE